jgi:hypothetical protein
MYVQLQIIVNSNIVTPSISQYHVMVVILLPATCYYVRLDKYPVISQIN